MRPTFSRLVVLLAILWPTIAMAQEAATPGVSLRPAWSEGQSARYQLWSKRLVQTKATVAGQTREAEQTIESTAEVTWKVDKVEPDGGATATMTIDWMTIDMAAGGQTAKNDSRKGTGEVEPVFKLLKALAGKPITVKVDADGSIASVSGVDRIRNSLGELKEMSPDESDFREMASDLAVLMDAPADATAGTTWDSSVDWRHELGKLHHDTTYTLTGVEEVEGVRLASVTSKSKLRLDVDRSKIPPEAPPMDIKMTDGSVESSTIFDLSRHEAIGRDSTQKLTLHVTVRHPQVTFQTVSQQTIQSQVLRIAEKP